MDSTFTYGAQFSAGDEPGQVRLSKLLELCFSVPVEERGGASTPERPIRERDALQSRIATEFFHHTNDPSGHAGNTVLSLNSYGLINIIDSTHFATTDLASKLYEMSSEEAHAEFAKHILSEHEGLLLLKVIEDMKARGESVTLPSLAYEFIDLGIEIPPNSVYISTMRSWLHQAGVFPKSRGYAINWDVVHKLVGLYKDLLDDLYSLNREHKYFLLALIHLDARVAIVSNKVAEYVRSVFKIRLTTKNLVSDIIKPIEQTGLIESFKTTKGRGAKPHEVKLTDLAVQDLLEPFLENISGVTGLALPSLNRSFESVVEDLDSEDSHIKGIALELLAVWVVRLLGLKFTEWRLRDIAQTGGGEVDVIAASDRFVYNRWQIQCKNTTNTIGVRPIAEEFGMSVVTNADIIVMVTTSRFSQDAINYVDLLMRKSRYYVVLIDGKDLKQVIGDRMRIIEILDAKARKAFFRREILSRQD